MLGDKKLFLLDIDGTICKGNQLIGGTKEFLSDIEKNGGKYIFITNNATRSIDDYILFFQQLGIMTNHSNFLTASYATVYYLKKYHPGELIYVMGTKSFIRELKKNKIRVTTDGEDEEISCVLISYDNQLTYEKYLIHAGCLVRRKWTILRQIQIMYVRLNLDMCLIVEQFVRCLITQ